MARIVGAVATSHIPLIGKAIAMGWQNDPAWKPFFDSYSPVQDWLRSVRPDVAVVVYNDHGLNFFLDKMPTFAVGAASEYTNADEGWGLPVVPPFPGHPELSWHVIESLVADEFDVTSCQEMAVDHGFAVPMALLWGKDDRRIKTIPVCVNTVQFPLPSPARCYKLGQAIAHAIHSYPDDLRVVVLGTGGLSHQLEGERAGFINKPFDLMCCDAIAHNVDPLLMLSSRDLVREAGSQGVELLAWLVMRGTVSGCATQKHFAYHGAVSNTAAALMLLA
ncbi:MAG TPA: class III extradiol dioxygenase family protein [Vicinamibacterales bacterium]|nr:class III extradiol dioxygenase family protein [Vicinamibacterales bacterium]